MPLNEIFINSSNIKNKSKTTDEEQTVKKFKHLNNCNNNTNSIEFIPNNPIIYNKTDDVNKIHNKTPSFKEDDNNLSKTESLSHEKK